VAPHGTAADPRTGPLDVPGSRRQQVQAAAWFVGLCVALAALSAAVSGAAPALVPFILAIGPAFIAVGLAWREGHGALRRLGRSLTLRPADAHWYLVLLIPVGWALAVVGVALALGEPTTGLFDELTLSALFIPFVVVLPAFAEEVAWRGYAVSRLLGAMSPLSASLVLAVPWTVMHLVLLLPGGMNEGAALWPSFLSLFAYSVVLTWVFIGTGGSVLVAALAHAGLNGVVPIMGGVDPDLSWALRAVLAAVIAVLVIALGGFRRIAGRS
jgi:membrane protease YdiL (CAAX protease family)